MLSLSGPSSTAQGHTGWLQPYGHRLPGQRVFELSCGSRNKPHTRSFVFCTSAMSAINLSVLAHKNGLNARALFIHIISRKYPSPHPLHMLPHDLQRIP